MTDPHSPLHVRHLARLGRRRPLAEKLVLVPRTQLGYAVEDALAREEGGWIGWTVQDPATCARGLIRAHAAENAVRALPRGGEVFLTARVLEEAHDSVRSVLEGADGRGLVRPLARTLDTLRMHGVDPEDLRAGGSRQQALGALLESYQSALSQLEYQDQAALLGAAADLVRAERPAHLGEVVLAVFGETELPGRTLGFVRALEERVGTCVLIGPEDGETRAASSPPTRAANRLRDWPKLAASDSGESGSERAGEVRFLECAGAETEVREVMRTVLEKEIPLEEVEIAYTASDPYLSLIAEAADRYELPISLSTGRPALSTAPAQALRGFYDWIAEDFDAALLIRLLRGRLVRVHRVFEEPLPISEARAATMLAAHRYDRGREGYRSTLDAAVSRRRRAVEELREKGEDVSEVEEEWKAARAVRELVGELLGTVPRGRTPVTKMAAAAERFLERFGPVDRPDPDLAESEWSQAEQDRQVLIDHLREMQEGPDYRASPPALAARLRELLTAEYVQAERPGPGKAHVVPLEGAGYGDRRHLFVVGMDAESMDAPSAEDALLLDREREEVGERAESVLPLLRDAPDEAAWTAIRALQRHRGDLTLLTRSFDVEALEEMAPSALYLQLRRRWGGSTDAEVRGLSPPNPDRSLMLEDAEAWLGVLGAETRGEESAAEAVPRIYPWIGRGLEAAARRQSDRYTEYDGLLPDPPYPELDAFGPEARSGAISASRIELLADAPYVYFLKHVLGVEPLEEPALEETGWLDRLHRGKIVHDTLETFVSEIGGRPPRREDETLLLEILDRRLDRFKEELSPPNAAIERADRHGLREDLRVFLRSELAREESYEARHQELGFGLGPRRSREGDRPEPVTLALGEELSIRLRGRIDRIDRLADGSLIVWDYKTGSRRRFSEGDPLQGGTTVQWALYAAAAERLVDGGGGVWASGYFFTSLREMGERLVFPPAAHERELEAVVRRLAELPRTGTFPMHHKAAVWRYGGFDRICPDTRARGRELSKKQYPEDRPRPPHLDEH